jgi:hypothetical protein
MDEQDVIDQVQVLEQDGANQAVEVAAGNEAVALGNGGHRLYPFISCGTNNGLAQPGRLFIIPCSFASFKAAFARDVQSTPLFLQAVAFPWLWRRPGIKVATSQQ